MHSKLFIPSKVNVGFQNRQDTYTKKLAYVIYYDKKGVLRKETSWNSWRDQKIPNIEYDNTPTEGFVLNKGVGGYKSDWNFRSAHIRVYDPRDFEFEISVENLLFILKECDCTKGKGLEGKFVYAWQGTELVLLPASSLSYQESMGYTDLQGQDVSFKDLVEGCTVITKEDVKLIYIGRRMVNIPLGWRHTDKWKPAKHHVFVDQKGKCFEFIKDAKKLAKIESSECHQDYAELVDRYNNSKYSANAVSFEAKPWKKQTGQYWVEMGYELVTPTHILTYNKHMSSKKSETSGGFKIENGIVTSYYINRYRNVELKDGVELVDIDVVLNTGIKKDLREYNKGF